MASRSSKPHAHTNSSRPPPPPSRACLCSPTSHPGSFRCSLHKKSDRSVARPAARVPSSNHHHWESSAAAKANSFKAFLVQIIKPSSHDLHRRKNFQPKPTRFCLMNSNRDAVAVS